jgi:glyoxylase-like metal-dependent hydrolase (beta-lactamase superfamily II)
VPDAQDMTRRLLLWVLLLLGAALAAAGAVLLFAHVSIRRIDPPLPSVDELLRERAAADLPVRLRWIETASQRMPRSAVLDASRDPTQGAPYRMSHASFVLEWADGRIFLIDAGMEREAAVTFGRPLERLAGAAPVEPGRSVAEALGPAVERVAGIAFTHLHTDHTQGVAALCEAAHGRGIRLFQGRLQAERTNYTTRAGAAQLAAAPCLEREVLADGALLEIPGFGGLAMAAAAGHTPGSQLLVAHVRQGEEQVHTWVFTGDVVNALDGIRHEIGKPLLYRLLMVPESPARLRRVRAFLRELDTRPRVDLLVSHDALALEASGLERF